MRSAFKSDIGLKNPWDVIEWHSFSDKYLIEYSVAARLTTIKCEDKSIPLHGLMEI